MATGEHLHSELLPHLFRQEYAKMTATLCRHFGLQQIEIAEDIASDTFLKASESWAIDGVPEKPVHWLYTVAKNKARDYFRRQKAFIKQDGTTIDPGPEFDFDKQVIQDSQLAMIFAVCNPINPVGSQISLALQILCGFSLQEIATALLTNPETIKKRLLRARKILRSQKQPLTSITAEMITARLDTVVRTLYLLFNEGYSSATNNHLIRTDLCAEAARLTFFLTEHPGTDKPEVNALLALICFQSSRLPARLDNSGDIVLYEEQDRALWDSSLIERGNYYLVRATNGNTTSKYHLEAAIAYWHAAPATNNKWEHILALYNQLMKIDNAPQVLLGRIFSLAKVQGCHVALPEAERSDLERSAAYHSLLAYLYRKINIEKSSQHYKTAIQLSKSTSEQRVLEKQLAALLSSQ